MLKKNKGIVVNFFKNLYNFFVMHKLIFVFIFAQLALFFAIFVDIQYFSDTNLVQLFLYKNLVTKFHCTQLYNICHSIGKTIYENEVGNLSLIPPLITLLISFVNSYLNENKTNYYNVFFYKIFPVRKIYLVISFSLIFMDLLFIFTHFQLSIIVSTLSLMLLCFYYLYFIYIQVQDDKWVEKKASQQIEKELDNYFKKKGNVLPLQDLSLIATLKFNSDDSDGSYGHKMADYASSIIKKFIKKPMRYIEEAKVNDEKKILDKVEDNEKKIIILVALMISTFINSVVESNLKCRNLYYFKEIDSFIINIFATILVPIKEIRSYNELYNYNELYKKSNILYVVMIIIAILDSKLENNEKYNLIESLINYVYSDADLNKSVMENDDVQLLLKAHYFSEIKRGNGDVFKQLEVLSMLFGDDKLSSELKIKEFKDMLSYISQNEKEDLDYSFMYDLLQIQSWSEKDFLSKTIVRTE